jgi:peptidoglycan glycosyltransferase
VNDQIVKLFAAILVLFALLVFFSSKITVFNASALNHDPLNHLTAIRQAKVDRGEILADNGEVLAKSVKHTGGLYTRTYPQGALFAQAVGYQEGSGDDAGLESYYDSALEGTKDSVSSVFGPLSSAVQHGDTLHTSLDPKAQAVARQELAGRTGSVVALDPSTGAVLAMYSNPSYDPNDLKAAGKCTDGCLVNRAIAGAYPPGSTFKIVTTTAAINSGKYTPESTFNGHEPVIISGVPLYNDQGDPPYGYESLSYALEQSINTIFAPLAVDLGIPTMTNYMKRFGFYAKLPIDLPAGEGRVSNVISPAGKDYPAGSQDEDIGRIGIGQGGLAVTPLQMAMVASAVADNGKLMTPHLVSRITDPDGQTVRTIAPRLYHQVMTAHSAQEINQMMRDVVDEGTGTPASLGGIAFAGKTGTASVGATGSNETQPWFIGFAPAQDPKVAVAVDIERTDDGSGGQVAGPIAAAVVRTLLDEGK